MTGALIKKPWRVKGSRKTFSTMQEAIDHALATRQDVTVEELTRIIETSSDISAMMAELDNLPPVTRRGAK